MKTWKAEIINAIAEKAKTDRVVSLREVAGEHGIRHISASDVRDIQIAATEALPGYRPVRMMSSPNDSLFCSLCFVEKAVEFEDHAE